MKSHAHEAFVLTTVSEWLWHKVYGKGQQEVRLKK